MKTLQRGNLTDQEVVTKTGEKKYGEEAFVKDFGGEGSSLPAEKKGTSWKTDCWLTPPDNI